jgi:hypothetical protein
MARDRRGKPGRKAKPGRETTRPRASTAEKKARHARAVDKRLVNDRVSFLKANALHTKTFKTRDAAIEFASEQMLVNGLDYDVKKRGRTVTLKGVDFKAVQESTEMKQIRNDLRTKSRSATGKRARALEALGRRENFFDWPVGETPS